MQYCEENFLGVRYFFRLACELQFAGVDKIIYPNREIVRHR